ncbi:ABC transporter permease/M1 family aminopeptidase [Aestuariibacter salexigens]|uniref:ABC transporter permease/M1 family aminopeptidase n=1 Tax=Aestuariibacter salexigens TaxID=226010 RepID=UPI000478E65C|nr:M1 family aminopeptidase [Aestuariibacter salexigens]
MLTKMLSFEWRYFTKQPSFIVTGLVFFLLPFLAMTIDNVQIGATANVNFNSPFAITQAILILGIFSMFLVVNFVSDTALRNDSSKMAEIVCTKPVSAWQYQLGRFFGAYLVCVTIYAMVPLGLFLGAIMPWVDSERLGPNTLAMYALPFVYFSLTTLFVLSAIFYAAALKFRSQVAVYLVAVGLFILYVVSGNLLDDPAYRSLAALADPYGLRAFADQTRYWTTFERNNQLVEFSGIVLQNRLIWLLAGIIILALFGGLRKGLSLYVPKDKKKKNKQEKVEAVPMTNRLDYKPRGHRNLLQFWTRTRFEIKQIMTSPGFYILLAFSAFNLIAQLIDPSALYDAPNWPLTQDMLNLISGAFGLMMIIIVTYYSAEAVWRERSVGMGDIVDSMPVFNLSFWLSKLIAVCLVFLSIYTVSALVTICYQLIKGYGYLDLGQYAITIGFFFMPTWILLAILAFLIQAMSPNKYVGMLIFVGYFFVSIAFGELGLEHNMYNYAAAPQMQYSDMNGFGWYLTTQTWYLLYWSSLALIFCVISYGLWQRGPQVPLKARFSMLTYNVGRSGLILAALGFVGFVTTGAVIYHNTQVKNVYFTSDQLEDLQEAYERQFGQHLDDNIPVITKVDTSVDIYPYQQRIEASADIVFENRYDTPIEKFLVGLPQSTPMVELTMQGGTLGETIGDFRTAWFIFDEPLMPGEQRTGAMKVVREHDGFRDSNFDTLLLENGTFINNAELFPTFGYNEGFQISDRHERRKRGLPELQRAWPLESEQHQREGFFGKGGAEIMFSATLSTSDDQFAIAPGYLTRQWQENGRNYYRYEMDKPMLNFFSLMSANVAAKKEEYKGISIEVYYHPAHYWNVDRMMESVRDSIDYFTEVFGPYQHKQVRIIEFPGYRSFAQSFANTVPYSERIGFITDIRDDAHIDPVYYVTAHEVAHQWWAHQVIPANVQGSAIISESLSQYSALMVMKRKYGEAKLRTFLTYELDSYLRGRSTELIREIPMLRAENQQYIHYRKGSVVMMALADKLGDDHVNAALKSLVDTWYGRTDRYPTTLDLVNALKLGATQEEQDFIDAQFTEITLYELITKSAKAEQSDTGYTVTLDIDAKRFVADGEGQEQEQTMEEWVDIVLFANDPDDFAGDTDVLYQQKHKLVSGENQVVINVEQKPAYAGVDPFVRYIDRDTDNNILPVSE